MVVTTSINDEGILGVSSFPKARRVISYIAVLDRSQSTESECLVLFTLGGHQRAELYRRIDDVGCTSEVVVRCSSL